MTWQRNKILAQIQSSRYLYAVQRYKLFGQTESSGIDHQNHGNDFGIGQVFMWPARPCLSRFGGYPLGQLIGGPRGKGHCIKP